MPHALLIAVIFAVYMGAMIAFGAYIRHTGIPREHRDGEHDDTLLDDPGGDPRQDEPGGLLAVA